MRFLRKKAIEKNILYTQSIACAFGLAAAAPRSPYRHLELCGISLTTFKYNLICRTTAKEKSRRRADNLTRPFETAALISEPPFLCVYTIL